MEDEAEGVVVESAIGGEGVRRRVVVGLALFFLKNGTGTASVEAIVAKNTLSGVQERQVILGLGHQSTM